MAPRRIRRGRWRDLLAVRLRHALCASGGIARADVADYLGKPVGVGAAGRSKDARPTEPRADAGRRNRAGPAAVDGAGARDASRTCSASAGSRTCSVDATLEDGRVALRYELVPIHPVVADPLHAAAGRAGHRRGRAAPRRRRPLRRVAAARPRRRHDAHPRRRAARARLPARRRSRRGRRSSTRRSARRWSSRSTRARGRRSATVEVVGHADGARGELLARLGLAPGAPYQREALNARIERYIEERRKPRLLRSEDRAGGRG